MLSAVLSFLGGSAFRMLWGEAVAFLGRRQDHAQEMARAAQQESFAAAAHARTLESMRLQKELGVEVIRVQADVAAEALAGSTFLEGVRLTGLKTGVAWVDAWNASIRPGAATWALTMLTLEAFAAITLSEGSASVCYAALGLFLADRALAKRGR